MIEAAVRSQQHMVSPGTRRRSDGAAFTRRSPGNSLQFAVFVLFSGVRDRVKWRAGGDPLCASRSRLKTLFLLNGLELWLNLLPVCRNTRSPTESRSITERATFLHNASALQPRSLGWSPAVACSDKHLLKYCNLVHLWVFLLSATAHFLLHYIYLTQFVTSYFDESVWYKKTESTNRL